jgi:hypothetical protein
MTTLTEDPRPHNAMRRLVLFVALAMSIGANAAPNASEAFETLVDGEGNITLPAEFRRTWAFLGTWSIAQEDVEPSSAASGHGAAGLHNVYVQPDAITAYRKDGEFPDGTVLVKELLKTTTESMTTGMVSRGADVEGWFVMVKDRHQRFPNNALWGDGWGWVLFGPDGEPQTTNYKAECLGCHIPAKSTDWIYVQGYPMLR